MTPNNFLDYQWLENPVERWLIAAAIVAVATATLWGLKQLAVKRLKAFTQRTRTQFDDLLVALLDVGTPMCRARGRPRSRPSPSLRELSASRSSSSFSSTTSASMSRR